MDRNDLAELRRNYSLSELSKGSVALDPFEQFSRWMDDALRSELLDATAMNLATSSPDGRVSSRVVLLKGFDQAGFVFYTNYESRKSWDLAANPNAALHFFWAQLERQINIIGRVVRVSAEESDEYFASRPFESRISALASHQSQKVESRKALEDRVAELTKKFADGNVPRPQNWGGYCVSPERFEFWQGRESRLHDRICYELASGDWTISRLSP